MERKDNNSSNNIVKVVIVLLLLAAGVFIGVKLAGGGNSIPTNTFVPELDENATDWDGTRPTPQATPEPVGIKIPGYPTITLPANTTDVFLGIQNPEGNPCYFTYTLFLKDSGEVLYTSKMVAPGKSITQATLTRALAPGQYPAVLNISTNSLTDGSPMNGANMETTLVVK